jgi:hypothetical protein
MVMQCGLRMEKRGLRVLFGMKTDEVKKFEDIYSYIVKNL